MTNPFQNRASTLNGPATDLVPVTPHNTNDLADVALALYVETGGSLSIVTVKGETRSVTVGDLSILPVGVRRVRNNGTTATGIHAFTVS
ncbi:spike base protein, RCAP_Rcc01079 family [Algicella marina]|uniref:Uncharacterized protein n=1 Tax=Algicella marina TaxID=2683284 RepID=A0A6P1T559_9RHOB|nr:hypothetical protein [Algicella marina]QHQ36409.1 hypothetical protein GO499_15110 [Algicella marina]